MIPILGEIQIDETAISSQGYTVAIVGWLIVFTALILLVVLFTNIPNLIYYNSRKKLRAEKRAFKKAENEDRGDDCVYISNEVSAAIAMSINLFFSEQHDEESNVITIKQVKKRYSPWSSKIYGIRNWPNN
ncbi:MAG: OadG family protein [Bacteroidota bacterium]|nr:OadG family protein [Bacteroidota bacterium]